MAEPTGLPALKDIAGDLKRIVKDGLGGLDESVELPVLGSLTVVQQEMQGEESLDRLVAVERLVGRAIETLDGTPSHEPLRLLFGVARATKGKLAKQRRRAAARAAGSDPSTFNRHDEQRFLRLLARSIYTLESEARLRAERLGPPPSAEEVKGAWFERFAHYQRLQGILRQLRLDLIAVLLTYSTHPDETGQEDYLDSSTWRFAQFLASHERFGSELGGIWLMPEPEADAEARTAVELVLWHAPFNERGRSWLRTTLSQVPEGELHPFADRLRDGPDGTEMLGLWEQWLESCTCDPDHPKAECRPHQVIDQCERFDIVVEDQWAIVRDTYRGLPRVLD